MTNFFQSPFYLAALVLGLFITLYLIGFGLFVYFMGSLLAYTVWVVLFLFIACLIFISRQREEPVRGGYRFLVTWLIIWNGLTLLAIFLKP